MSSSLSKFVDNLSEGIHNNKCLDCNSCIDLVRITKNEKLLLKCFNCDSYYKKKFNKDLIKKFKNTYSFCNSDLNKLILLLRKGVYPYKYMDSWEKFNETSLPSKEDFYSNLNMEDIDDIDYRHGNNVFKGFKLENLGDYHDLYVQSDTLLADVFENYNKDYILEVDVKYPKRLHELHSDLPFLSERMKVSKCNKLVCNLFNKKKICSTHKFFKASVKS